MPFICTVLAFSRRFTRVVSYDGEKYTVVLPLDCYVKGI